MNFQFVIPDLNKQDLVKDKLFHLNEPFQLINNRVMHQSIPSLTIPPGTFLMGEFPTPWAKKEFKPPTLRA